MMMGKYLTLPSFQSLVDEADSNVGGPCGTIALTLALDLSSEILPKYCYNGTTQRYTLDLIHQMFLSPCSFC